MNKKNEIISLDSRKTGKMRNDNDERITMPWHVCTNKRYFLKRERQRQKLQMERNRARVESEPKDVFIQIMRDAKSKKRQEKVIYVERIYVRKMLEGRIRNLEFCHVRSKSFAPFDP